MISIEAAGKIIEVDHAGKIVWTFQTEPKRTPYQAHRLPNGNTLVTSMDDRAVIEFDRAGKEVSRFKTQTQTIRVRRY